MSYHASSSGLNRSIWTPVRVPVGHWFDTTGFKKKVEMVLELLIDVVCTKGIFFDSTVEATSLQLASAL